MKKVLFRILAYVLDTIFVFVIILGFSYISFVNPNKSVLNEKYEDYYNATDAYKELKDNLEKYFEDGKLSDREILELTVNYPDFEEIFKDIPKNEDISHDDYLKTLDKIDKKQIEINKVYSYEIDKLNYIVIIIGIVVNILYFGLLQYILHGQTIFKKLFRIRVIDKDDKKKRVPLWKHLIRSILISEIIITATDLILLFVLKQSAYFTANGWISQIKYIYEMAFLVTLIIRDDNRSIHDILLNTEVVRFDKSGKVIEEKLFKDFSEEDEKVINKSSKNVSKKSSKLS